jgi:hypothetical protein
MANDLLQQLMQAFGSDVANNKKFVDENVQKNSGFWDDLGKNMQQGYNQVLPQPEQPLNNGMQQFGQSIGMSGNTSVGPYQEGVLKGLKKAGEEHAYNAASAGMNPDMIMQHPIMGGSMPQPVDQSQLPQPADTQSNSNANSPVANPNGNNNPTLKTDEGFWSLNNANGQPGAGWQLLSIMAGGGFKQARQTPGESAQILQQLMGKVPLQQGEKQKMITEGLFNLPNQYSELQKNATQAIPALQSLLTPGEKMGMMFGNIPESLKLQKQVISGATGLTGNALVSKLQRIKEISSEQSSPMHSEAQINAYNKARSSGMSQAEASKKAGL